MSNLSSYQKLKQRICELEMDIYLLVKHGDQYPGQSVKTKWEMYFDLHTMVTFGTRKQITCKDAIELRSGGIIEQIMKSEITQ